MRIHHFLKVHSLAKLIGEMEHVDKETLFIIESAAIVHDIGIHICETKYHSTAGCYQEKEGPNEAEKILNDVGGYTSKQIERICWLVGHHHTYSNIKNIDHQILVEADFLVNILEDNLKEEQIKNIETRIFKTDCGKRLLNLMYIK